jgi:4-amino-4-deoxy-L-arabinose transferase-like glycosyltransferase
VSVGTAVSGSAHAAAPVQRARSLIDDPAVAWVGALMILAALLRFYRIAHQGFWFDEGNTALEVHFSLGQMLTLLKHYESTPPLYYGVAWIWARLFGYAEGALRSLSALFGVLTVPVVYATGTKLVSRRAGVIAAALTATSPLLIWYSQEARAYELGVLLSAASLLAFAYARDEPSPRWIAAWVIASALALATEYYAILLVAPEALWLLCLHHRRPPVRVGVAALALCCAPLLWFAISQNATGHAAWIHHAPLGRRTAQIFPQFVSGFTSPGYSVLEPIAVAIVVFGLILLVTRSVPGERHGAVLAGAIALAGLLLNFLLVAVGIDDLLTRNVISLWIPAAVAVAGGFAAARARLAGLIAAAALCLIGATAAIAIANNRDFQRPDWRGVARLLGARPPTGSPGRAILIQHYRDLLPLSLYVPGLRFLARAGAPVSEFDVVAFTSPRSAGFCWWGSACNLWPSTLQRSYPIPGFRVTWRRQFQQFTVLHMVATRGPVTITPSAVAPVLRTTTLRVDDLLLQR